MVISTRLWLILMAVGAVLAIVLLSAPVEAVS